MGPEIAPTAQGKTLNEAAYQHYKDRINERWIPSEHNRLELLSVYHANRGTADSPAKMIAAEAYAHANLHSMNIARTRLGEGTWARRLSTELGQSPDKIGADHHDLDPATSGSRTFLERFTTMAVQGQKIANHVNDNQKRTGKKDTALYFAMPDEAARKAYENKKGIVGQYLANYKSIITHPAYVHGMRIAHQVVADMTQVAQSMFH